MPAGPAADHYFRITDQNLKLINSKTPDIVADVSQIEDEKKRKIKFPKGMTKKWQPDVGVLNLSKKSTSQTK